MSIEIDRNSTGRLLLSCSARTILSIIEAYTLPLEQAVASQSVWAVFI